MTRNPNNTEYVQKLIDLVDSGEADRLEEQYHLNKEIKDRVAEEKLFFSPDPSQKFEAPEPKPEPKSKPKLEPLSKEAQEYFAKFKTKSSTEISVNEKLPPWKRRALKRITTKLEKENKRLRNKIRKLKKEIHETDRLSEIMSIYKKKNDDLIKANSDLSNKNCLLDKEIETVNEIIDQKDSEIANLKKIIEKLEPDDPVDCETCYWKTKYFTCEIENTPTNCKDYLSIKDAEQRGCL